MPAKHAPAPWGGLMLPYSLSFDFARVLGTIDGRCTVDFASPHNRQITDIWLAVDDINVHETQVDPNKTPLLFEDLARVIERDRGEHISEAIAEMLAEAA